MMQDLIKIYSHLCDDESKYLFDIRLKYSLLRDCKKFKEEVYPLKKYKFTDLFEFLMEFSEKKSIILFGAGDTGEYLYHLLKDYGYGDRVIAFGDNDITKQKKYKNGLIVYSTEDIVEKYQDAIILISSSKHGLEIYSYLLRMGIKRQNIYYPRYKRIMGMTGEQYFDLPYLEKSDEEIYIDGGCFDGDSCLDFIKWSNYKYKKIIAFEPNLYSYQKCKKMIINKNLKNIEIIPKGLYNKETSLNFLNKGPGSKVLLDGSTHIDVTSIDNVLNGNAATFIKLDIEGCELEALKGAKNTIIKYHPKLAICVYHKPEDIFEIPKYILSLVPNYKLYIRHYSNVELETVLYAL